MHSTVHASDLLHCRTQVKHCVALTLTCALLMPALATSFWRHHAKDNLHIIHTTSSNRYSVNPYKPGVASRLSLTLRLSQQHQRLDLAFSCSWWCCCCRGNDSLTHLDFVFFHISRRKIVNGKKRASSKPLLGVLPESGHQVILLLCFHILMGLGHSRWVSFYRCLRLAECHHL